MIVSNFNFAILNLNSERQPTMNFDYRVIYLPSDEMEFFVIREVFYNDDGEIVFWSTEDAVPTGETFEDLCDEFDAMAEAFEKPILMLTIDEDGNEDLVEIDDEEEEESDAE